MPSFDWIPATADHIWRHLGHPRQGWAFGWSTPEVEHFQLWVIQHLVRPGYVILGLTSLIIWLVMVLVMRKLRQRGIPPTYVQKALRTFMFWKTMLWLDLYERSTAHWLSLIWDGWALIVVVLMALSTAVLVAVAYVKRFLWDPFREAPPTHRRRRISIPIDEVV